MRHYPHLEFCTFSSRPPYRPFARNRILGKLTRNEPVTTRTSEPWALSDKTTRRSRCQTPDVCIPLVDQEVSSRLTPHAEMTVDHDRRVFRPLLKDLLFGPARRSAECRSPRQRHPLSLLSPRPPLQTITETSAATARGSPPPLPLSVGACPRVGFRSLTGRQSEH